MLKVVVFVACLSVGVWGGGIPLVTPSVGKVWPKPQLEVTEETYVTVRPDVFSFTVADYSCDLLTKAVARYMDIMFPKEKKTGHTRRYRKTRQFRGYLDTVTIHLFAECEDLPYLHMDEHYEIKVDSPDQPGEASIMAPSVWGVMRALETFSQLLVPDGDAYRIYSTQLMDYPRFAHRGFMIDTARHFLPLATIKDMLDLMSMNKFNVLHWHVVDSQSFPYESSAYPSLSAEGAYLPYLVYSADDISEIVSYAIERGIRVLPEFDTPGHTDSWGLGQADLLTECYTDNKPDGTYGPIDPSNEANYDFLKELLTEVTQRFPDHYLHLGGDEVSFNCWASNPNLTEFMHQNNISGNYAALEQYYITKLLALVADLPTGNGYLVWQEVFDNGVKLADDTVVHVWKDGNNPDGIKEELSNVTNGGFQTLLSSCWYLNAIKYGVGWETYYECDPQDFNGTEAQKALVIGGEACMWGEYVDKTNIISRSWPTGSVVAERLWSSAASTNDTKAAEPRLEEHRCRLLNRGYAVEPLWPSYCATDNEP